MEEAAAAGAEDDDGAEEGGNLSRRMAALNMEGGEEYGDGGTSSSTSTSNSAVSSSRQLSLSTVASGDPVTREWEELPSLDLIRQIFRSPSHVTRAASTGRVLSPRTRFRIWPAIWRPRPRSRHQEDPASQLSPLAPSPPPAEPSQPTSEELRSHAIDTLVQMVHQDLERMIDDTEEEADALLAVQAELKQRRGAIESALRAFQEEKEELEQKLRVVLENIDALEEWGRQNGCRKPPEGGCVDIDTVFVPRDGLSVEILRCRSADRTVEDLDTHLEKAVQERTLEFRLYLETMRDLGRRLFFLRASTVMLEIVDGLLAHEAEMDDTMGEPSL